MKSLRLTNGELKNIKSFEISGDNFGWDIWYIDAENNEALHNLVFEKDLDEVLQLNKLIWNMVKGMSRAERTKFTFTKEV